MPAPIAKFVLLRRSQRLVADIIVMGALAEDYRHLFGGSRSISVTEADRIRKKAECSTTSEVRWPSPS